MSDFAIAEKKHFLLSKLLILHDTSQKHGRKLDEEHEEVLIDIIEIIE